MDKYTILPAVGSPGFMVLVNGRWCLGTFRTRYAARKAIKGARS